MVFVVLGTRMSSLYVVSSLFGLVARPTDFETLRKLSFPYLFAPFLVFVVLGTRMSSPYVVSSLFGLVARPTDFETPRKLSFPYLFVPFLVFVVNAGAWPLRCVFFVRGGARPTDFETPRNLSFPYQFALILVFVVLGTRMSSLYVVSSLFGPVARPTDFETPRKLSFPYLFAPFLVFHLGDLLDDVWAHLFSTPIIVSLFFIPFSFSVPIKWMIAYAHTGLLLLFLSAGQILDV